MTRTHIIIASFTSFALLGASAAAQPAPEHKHNEKGAEQAQPTKPTGGEHAEHHPEAPATKAAVGDPYPLGVCPISGMALGSMGEAIVKVYDGREVRFCCNGCPEKFEADKEANFKKIDAMIVADQLAYYPLDMCVVSGEPLTVDGKDIAFNLVYNNRLVRLSRESHITDFKAEPAKYMATLDAAVAAAQRGRYPLDRCVVSGEAMADLPEEDVVEVVVANRLFRLCCPPCKPDVLANPASYVQKLDEAWAKSPGGMPSADGLPKAPDAPGTHQHSGPAPGEHKHEHEHGGARGGM